MGVRDLVEKFNMQKHPEGGYYKETYRSGSEANFENFEGKRNYATGIYFLVEATNFSAFHKIKSEEMWHFYGGDPLEVIEITLEGKLITTTIGNNIESGEVFQYTVKAGNWFASRVKKGGQFSFVGCTVWPGFDFRDFVLADKISLQNEFPQHKKIIDELTR